MNYWEIEFWETLRVFLVQKRGRGGEGRGGEGF
jgi:hypothetical protein